MARASISTLAPISSSVAFTVLRSGQGIGPMLGQVARTSREYPVLPGTTEDQGVLRHMSTVLLTVFGYLNVATQLRPLLHRERRNTFRRNAVALPLC
jgi:hypothetical protein